LGADVVVMVRIPGENVPDALPAVIGLLRRGEERSWRRFSIRETLEECIADRMQMWVVWDDDERKVRAVVLTKVLAEPDGRKVLIVHAMVGNGMDQWLPLVVETLKAFGEEQGCYRMKETGRRGLVAPLKALGWRPVQVVMEMRLGDG